MNNEHSDRRKQELDILCMSLFQEGANSKSIINGQIDKREIRKMLRQMSCNNLDLTAPIEKNVLDCSFSYEYQRYDGIISYKYAPNIIPLFDNPQIAKRTFFISSGMGAISSFIISLYTFAKYTIKYSPDIYFETIDILSKFNRENGIPVYYIDSIQIKPESTHPELFDSLSHKIIVLDTTCWSYDQSAMTIAKLLAQEHICIALRSHTKLDMLGLEYSKLGSITYYINKSSGHDQLELLKDILSNHMSMIGHLGIWATPDAFPAFWREERFMKVNSNRINAIRNANTKAAKVLLEASSISFVLPSHSLFILINPLTKTNNTPVELNIHINMFVVKEQSKGFPVRKAGGFGFDDVVVDLYFDNQVKQNTVRLSYGDIPFELIEQITLDLQEVINDFQN